MSCNVIQIIQCVIHRISFFCSNIYVCICVGLCLFCFYVFGFMYVCVIAAVAKLCFELHILFTCSIAHVFNLTVYSQVGMQYGT